MSFPVSFSSASLRHKEVQTQTVRGSRSLEEMREELRFRPIDKSSWSPQKNPTHGRALFFPEKDPRLKKY